MLCMIRKELVVLFASILLISIVSAQLSISTTDEIYNIGDKLYVNIDGIVGTDAGNVNLNLVCSNNTVNLLKVSARAFSSTTESSYSLPYKILNNQDLEIPSVASLVGECYLQASASSQVVSGAKFKISNTIKIDATSDKTYYNPGEELILDISTKKENGQDYSGELKLSNFTEDIVLIESAKQVGIDLAENLAAGEYSISIGLEDGTGNIGSARVSFNINQIASRISFGVNTLDVTPGDNISISGEVLDQSGEIMYDLIEFDIISPRGLKIKKELQPGEDITEIVFPYNATRGAWKIVATAGDLRDELTLNILPRAHLEYKLESNILTVTNVGNSMFNDYFNITIGSSEKRVFAELSPSEYKQFALSAPSGDYQIGSSDGKSVFTGSTFLTGNAISIKDLSQATFLASPIIWLILIAVLGIGGYMLMQRNPKTKKITSKSGSKKSGFAKLKEKIKEKTPTRYRKEVSKTINFTTKSPEVQSIDEKNYKSEDSTMRDLTLNKLKTAEASLVLNGDKVTASVLALSISNYDQLNDNSKQGLEKVLESAKGSHAVIDKRNNYIFLLFVPQVTKTYRNELLATKAGIHILDALSAFNKKFKQKILFNLGINSGEMVVSKAGGKIRYTSLGNTLSFAKRLSDSSDSKMIINDEIRKKLLRDLKVEKHVTINEKQTFSVVSIKDRDANQEKLKELLKRM
jgi:hypothetical protein